MSDSDLWSNDELKRNVSKDIKSDLSVTVKVIKCLVSNLR